MSLAWEIDMTETVTITSKTVTMNTTTQFQNPLIEELHALREQLWQQAGENYATAIAQAHESTQAISATMRHIQSSPRKVLGARLPA
jgi:hypothetical protein